LGKSFVHATNGGHAARQKLKNPQIFFGGSSYIALDKLPKSNSTLFEIHDRLIGGENNIIFMLNNMPMNE
jgi:hypothetical protein